MANYHLAYKIGNAGFGGPHAEYVTRSGKYSKGHKKEDLQYKESGNMPEWGKEDPVKFWQAADIFENVNGRSYREFEVSLPNELSIDKNIDLMNEFKYTMLGNDFAYTYAIHKSYNNGQENTHAHFMFTERKNDGVERDPDAFFKRANFRYPEKGRAKKDRSWQKKEVLLNARKQFALITNKHLEMAGFEERVDHRSIKDQLEEALEKNDIEKVEYLTRPAVNIPGHLLNKEEKKLSILEKKSLSEFKEARQIKIEKEKEYRTKIVTLEKEDLIIEIKKTDQKLDKNKLRKSTLNSITNGDYYKLLNKNLRLKQELRSNPANMDIKAELENLKVKIYDIEEYLPETTKYMKKYKALETAYSNKKESLFKDLEDRFDIKREDLSEHIEERQEKTARKISKSKILEISLDYNKREKNKQTDLKNGIERLEKLLKSEERIKGIVLNKLTKGEYFTLENQKTPLKNMLDEFKDEKRILENKRQLTSKIYFIQIAKLNKDINNINVKISPLEKKYRYLNKKQSELAENIDSKLLEDRIAKLRNNIYRSLNKTKLELSSSKSKIVLCNDLKRSYKPLIKSYSIPHSKQNSNTLKKIGDLFQENTKLNNTKQNMKPKIFKREKDKDVAELER